MRRVAGFPRCLGRIPSHPRFAKRVTADLSQSIANYDKYLSSPSPSISSDRRASKITYSWDGQGNVTVNTGTPSEPVVTGGREGITWSEKTAILKKIDNGMPLSSDEFSALGLPISDLHAQTIQQDYGWVQALINGGTFSRGDFWAWVVRVPSATWPSVAWSLLGVTADTLKMIEFWKNSWQG